MHVYGGAVCAVRDRGCSVLAFPSSTQCDLFNKGNQISTGTLSESPCAPCLTRGTLHLTGIRTHHRNLILTVSPPYCPSCTPLLGGTNVDTESCLQREKNHTRSTVLLPLPMKGLSLPLPSFAYSTFSSNVRFPGGSMQ